MDSGQSDPCFRQWSVWPKFRTVVSLTSVMDSGQSDPCFWQWSVWPVLWIVVSLTHVIDSGQSDQCYGQWSVWPVLWTVVSLTSVLVASEEAARRRASFPGGAWVVSHQPAPRLPSPHPALLQQRIPREDHGWVDRPFLSPSHSPFHGRTMGELTDHSSVHPTPPSMGGPWVSWQTIPQSIPLPLPWEDHGWVDRPFLSPSHSPFHGRTMDELTETIHQSL